jgi:ribosomal protein S18 acetylase RimI-like enzyme
MTTLVCTTASFRPHVASNARWLDGDNEYQLAADFWRRTSCPLAYGDWHEAVRTYRYSYAVILRDGSIIAVAALLPYSTEAWELSAVKTDPAFRRCGHGRAIVSFVTAAILKHVALATCNTDDTNEAMIRTALGVGYSVAAPDEATRYLQSLRGYLAAVAGGAIPQQGEAHS